MSYCDVAKGHAWHGPYHDQVHGFPVCEDHVLFERLALEINQAGLSWLTVLKKRHAFQEAFDGFDIACVAQYGPKDRERLLGNAGIIRNRRKIDAVVNNAQVLVDLRPQYHGFHGWLQAHHPRPLQDWVALFRQTFSFVGGEIVNEFLMSTGYLPGAHRPECPVYAKILRLSPPWAQGGERQGPSGPSRRGRNSSG